MATWDIPEVFGSVAEHERTVLELLRRLRGQERRRDHGDADPVFLARLEAALGARFHRLVEGLIVKGCLRRVDDGIDLAGTFNGKFRRLAWDKPSCTVDTRFGALEGLQTIFPELKPELAKSVFGRHPKPKDRLEQLAENPTDVQIDRALGLDVAADQEGWSDEWRDLLRQ